MLCCAHIHTHACIHDRESFAYARRQFPLVDDTLLRYCQLNMFDQCMNACEAEHGWLAIPSNYVSLAHEADKVRYVHVILFYSSLWCYMCVSLSTGDCV